MTKRGFEMEFCDYEKFYLELKNDKKLTVSLSPELIKKEVQGYEMQLKRIRYHNTIHSLEKLDASWLISIDITLSGDRTTALNIYRQLPLENDVVSDVVLICKIDFLSSCIYAIRWEVLPFLKEIVKITKITNIEFNFVPPGGFER